MQTFSSCHNIKIDGDEFTSGFLGLDWLPSNAATAQKQRYESDTVAALNRLANTWTGWAIVNEIFYRQQKMTIRPYHPSPELGQFNAYAEPEDEQAATMKDTIERDRHGNMPPQGKSQIRGTGTGSDTIIRFSASTFAAPGAPTGPGGSADEILLHEMIHGLRQMQGRFVREAVNGNPGMDNYEEFAAITISNLYRSETGLSQLRSDHHGFTVLTGPTTNVATFRSTYRQYLSFMDIEQPRLCQNLRQVRCSFNPFVI